jgi:hypothetical protein
MQDDTPRPRPPATRPVTLAEAFATDAARARHRLAAQLQRVVRERHAAGDLDAARLAAAWLAETRGAA